MPFERKATRNVFGNLDHVVALSHLGGLSSGVLLCCVITPVLIFYSTLILDQEFPQEFIRLFAVCLFIFTTWLKKVKGLQKKKHTHTHTKKPQGGLACGNHNNFLFVWPKSLSWLFPLITKQPIPVCCCRWPVQTVVVRDFIIYWGIHVKRVLHLLIVIYCDFSFSQHH